MSPTLARSEFTLVKSMNPVPTPGMFFLQFQRELAASGQIAHLAETVAHVHWLYEGWTGLLTPLSGETKRLYEEFACYMVRYCSEVERRVAADRAVRWGQGAFEALTENLRSCDTTPDRADDLVASFIKQCLDVQRFALMHGSAQMSPQERVVHADILNEGQAQ